MIMSTPRDSLKYHLTSSSSSRSSICSVSCQFPSDDCCSLYSKSYVFWLSHYSSLEGSFAESCLWRMCGSLDLRAKVVNWLHYPPAFLLFAFIASYFARMAPEPWASSVATAGHSSVPIEGRSSARALPSTWCYNDVKPCTNWPVSPWAVPESMIGTDSDSLPH